jgi:hypothetical protein
MCLKVNLYFLAGVHGDREWDALKARDEVEGSLFWGCFEAL